MKKTILAFGNPVYDLIITPYLQQNTRILSGCSTNACLAATKLGERAILAGRVGADFEALLQSDLKGWGIESQLFPSRQTGGFHLVYDRRGDRTLSILGIADPLPAVVNGFSAIDFVLIGPILGEISADLVDQLRKTVQAPILVDPQGLLRRHQDGVIYHEHTPEFDRIARMATVVKANELETRVVTGIDPRSNPEEAVRALRAFGCQIAVVTLAEAGSIIYDGASVIPIPAYETNAIDPTGAGDTYAAGFMVKYLETPQDLRAVGCFASAVASVMVENSGPDFPLTRGEADRRAAALLNLPPALRL